MFFRLYAGEETSLTSTELPTSTTFSQQQITYNEGGTGQDKTRHTEGVGRRNSTSPHQHRVRGDQRRRCVVPQSNLSDEIQHAAVFLYVRDELTGGRSWLVIRPLGVYRLY